ncbi:MAG: leucine-rich repeat protein [Faecalimonas sp.]|nr:leucine-rich repeat protein [Faecalimonas sp.]
MKQKQVAVLFAAAIATTNTINVQAAFSAPQENTSITSQISSEQSNLGITDTLNLPKKIEQPSERELAEASGDLYAENKNADSDDTIENSTNEQAAETDRNANKTLETKKGDTKVAEIGTEFTVDEIDYEVTANTDTYEVAATDISRFETELNLPGEVTYEGITYQVTSIPDDGFQRNSTLLKVILPEGLKTIGSDAFMFCDSLEEIHLPSTLETFCKIGFESLKTITLAEGNQAFQLIDGVLFSKDGTTLRLYPSAKAGESYTTPDGTITISDSAFYNNQNLRSLTLSDSVRTVESYAFTQVQNMKTFECGKNVSEFGLYNFYQSPELQTVTLRGSYVLGSWCFNDCPKLERIEILDDIRGYGAYSFYDLPSLKEYVVNEGNLYYNTKDGVLYNGTDLLRYPAAKEGRTYVVPEETTEIAALAFSYMQNTTEVILPPNVYVATQAFNYPNTNHPIDIYFRDTEKIQMSKSVSGVFVALSEGSHIYLSNKQALESFLSYSNAINPVGSVEVEIKKIPVKKIILSETRKELKPHESFTLTSEILPSYYSENVTWSTSDPKVATVKEGVVTTVGYGDCQILLTSESGIQAACKVSVTQTDINTLVVSEIASQLYTGKEIQPEVTVKDGEYTLQEGIDYTVSYENNKNVGTGKILINGKGGYKGTKTVTFTIAAKDFKSVEIQEIPVQIYSGEEITPKLVVTDGEQTLVEGTDYTVSYENNVNAGIATAIVKGTGNYAGSQKIAFTIREKDLKNATIGEIDAQNYTGEEVKPKVVVKDGSITLKKNQDYTVSYKNNVNAGTATVIVEGTGNYCGKKETTFEISAKQMDSVTVKKIPNCDYNGSEQKPEITVMDGTIILREDIDFTASYSNNINAGIGTVVITGKGNYQGSKEMTFEIHAKQIEEVKVLPINDQIYTGEALTPDVIVKDEDSTLIKDKDYTVTYQDNTDVGTAIVEIVGKGNYQGRKCVSFKIGKDMQQVTVEKPENVIYKGTAFTPDILVTDGEKELKKDKDYTLTYQNNINVGTATVIVTGMGDYIGKQEVTFEIEAKSLDEVNVSEIEEQEYIGEAITPNITITDGEYTLILNQDYKLAYKNNIEVGTATVTISGIGNYTGVLQAQFQINGDTVTSPDHNNDGNQNIDADTQPDKPSEIPETGDMAQPYGNAMVLAFAGIGSILSIFKKKQKKDE